MTRLYVPPVPGQPLPPVTLTTIGKVPVPLGVPASVPLVASVRPAGRVLAVVNVAVPEAPVCVKFWLNATPAVPVVTAGFVTAIVLQTVIVKVCGVADPTTLVAWIVIVYTPPLPFAG